MPYMRRIPQSTIWQNNWAATPSITAGGLALTGNTGASNTEGSIGELFATTDFDSVGLVLFVAFNAQPAANRTMLIDILVGGAGAEVEIVTDMMMNNAVSLAGWPFPQVFLPLRIPKGSRVTARVRANATTLNGINIMATLIGGTDQEAPWPTFQGVQTIGANTVDSGGQAHTAGNTGAYSTWANLGAVSSRQFKAILPVMQGSSDTTMTNLALYIEIGIASVAVCRWLAVSGSGESFTGPFPGVPYYRNFPAGTQFMVRATASATADSNFDVGLLGFY